MGWPRLLALVRHAESEGNIRSKNERAKYGVPTHKYNLTSLGIKQAEITGEYLRGKFGYFDIYYASYYNRSKETMAVMFPEARVYEDPRLAEGQRGIWHTMTEEEIRYRYPEEFERRDREGLYHYRPFGGENWADIELRIHSFLGTLNRDYDDQDVLIVVHGHWLILFQRLLEHFSIEEAVKRYYESTAENASVTIYEDETTNGKSRLVFSEYVVPWEGKI
jgi:broad specificity phosphatase PhoE